MQSAGNLLLVTEQPFENQAADTRFLPSLRTDYVKREPET